MPQTSVDAFRGFCGKLSLEDGSSFALEDFQARMLADYFAGTTETLILISKKNGKSTLMAALAIHHMLTTPDCECVIAAASREQAEIVFGQASGFIRRDPSLQELMRGTRRELRSTGDRGRIRVMASDVDTADGVIPTLAIVDELHRHKDAGLYGVFRDGLGPRNGRMITISTAGDDEDSPLGRMRSAAYRLPTLVREGVYSHAKTKDNAYAMHEWALSHDDDRHDINVVKQANPASWQSIEALERRYNSPTMTDWQWARFACGVWLQGEDTAIGPVEWALCGTDEEPPADLQWRIGLDLGWKDDTTAIVPHGYGSDGAAWLGAPMVLVPTRDGTSLRKKRVLDHLRQMADDYNVSEVVLDPENDGEVIAQDIEEVLGLEVVAHSQKPMPMAQAAERFHAAVREGTLRHPRDDVLTRHVLNAHAKRTDDGRWRFVKENKQSKKVIDACIGAAMAHNVAVDEAQAPDDFVFEVFG